MRPKSLSLWPTTRLSENRSIIVLQRIYSTISFDILNTIIDQDDEDKDAWNKLADLFHDNKATRVVHLEEEFTNTHLRDFPNASTYCNRLKLLADQLANVITTTSPIGPSLAHPPNFPLRYPTLSFAPHQNTSRPTISPLQQSRLAHSSPNSQIPSTTPLAPPIYHMATCSQHSITKSQKILSFQCTTSLTSISPMPNNRVSALHDPNWEMAMHDEFDALIKNKTRDLVIPCPPGVNVIHFM